MDGRMDGRKELLGRVPLRLTRGWERKREGLYACAQPSNGAIPPQTRKICGVSEWLSLGPKTRAWLRLQLLMKQPSGDCDESNLELVLYLK